MAGKSSMEYINLGRSGLKVSKIILGCMSYGSSDWQPWVLDEEDALPLLKHAYDAGINTWDTADTYSNGRSEEIIGKALKHYNIPRSSVVLLSKIYFGVDSSGAQPPIAALSTNDGGLVNRVGLSRKHIFEAAEASVGRLGTYIDVLQLHRLDRSTPRAEIMRALNDVVDAGLARYIGASSMAAWEFAALQATARERGWHEFVAMQPYYNLLYREEEREMLPFCADAGIGVIPWSPLARGALCRPWPVASRSRGSVGSALTRREGSDGFLISIIRERVTEADEEIVGRVEVVARRLGVSMAAVATAWVLSKGCCPIVGLNSRARIEETCESIGLRLREEDVRYLEAPYMPKAVTGY